MFICLMFGSLLCTEIKEPVFVYVYWLCQVSFLFIDVTVGWYVLIFVVCFHFCFQMLKCIKKGYYVLAFFIGVGNRDIVYD
jgi:hypothetical protein